MILISHVRYNARKVGIMSRRITGLRNLHASCSSCVAIVDLHKEDFREHTLLGTVVVVEEALTVQPDTVRRLFR